MSARFPHAATCVAPSAACGASQVSARDCAARWSVWHAALELHVFAPGTTQQRSFSVVAPVSALRGVTLRRHPG
jgi:hypothetical protein